MSIICRAVERIDDPAPLALLLAVGGRAGAGFFRENRMTRVVTFDAIDDQPFGCEIRFGYQVDLTLVGNFDLAAEALSQDASGIARGLNGKIEQLFLWVLVA
jgi:hypothetical protein